jgi:hypothetical protein
MQLYDHNHYNREAVRTEKLIVSHLVNKFSTLHKTQSLIYHMDRNLPLFSIQSDESSLHALCLQSAVYYINALCQEFHTQHSDLKYLSSTTT